MGKFDECKMFFMFLCNFCFCSNEFLLVVFFWVAMP
jgi:hypothetical protein